MAKTLYVGNLSYDTTEEDLRELLGPYGAVESIRLISDKYSGRSRGFAFVEMALESEADAAMEALDGKEQMGRNLTVSVAKPRSDRGAA
ncbi:MAG: RNA-binding protein [Actinomycetota bacterium]|nr:RNA-binding protein [Actinomycetota bacterium]